MQRDTDSIRLKIRTEIPLISFLSIVSFALGTVILSLSLTRILVPVEAFVVLGSSFLTLGIMMLQQSSWSKPVPIAIVVTPTSKSFKYKDKVFISILLRIEFRKYFMFIDQGPSFGHASLAILYAYLHRNSNPIRYYANYTPFFANPWVTEREEPRHVGWLTMSSIAYIHLMDVILDPKNLVIESVAFRAPVNIIDIPHVYYEPERLSEILKRTIGKDMRDLEISKKTDVEIVVLGENVAPTTIRLSLGDIIMRVKELIGINKRLLDKVHEIPIDLDRNTYLF